MMRVSIVILNYNHPHNIVRLLPSLKKISGVDYEVIVVDNGSTSEVTSLLCQYLRDQYIDGLVLNKVNHYFSEGNNIGVRRSNPESNFILLLNSDTEILDGRLLSRLIEWAEGVPKTLRPYDWTTHPTKPRNIKRGIVSVDWGWDRDVPGLVRPEGWCCLIRREAWRDMSPDFPMQFGDMEMFASIVRDGYACGCLCQYGKYIKHYVGGTHPNSSPEYINKMGLLHTRNRKPEMKKWWAGLECESLDFTLGPNECQSFMEW